MQNLSNIFNTLEINKENGLFVTSENKWQEACKFPSRIKRLIETKLKPDAFFVFDNKPFILFYDSPTDAKSIHKAIWNFNETPIIIFAYNNSVEIYNGFKFLKNRDVLEKIGDNKSLNDFNYFELVSGQTWEKYQSNLKYENRIDFYLLENIETARNILTERNELSPEIANALIGKIIFVRYLIDRKVKIGFDKERYWTNDDLCTVLNNQDTAVAFFKYLENKFNGDMFFIEDSDYTQITQNSFNILIKLLNEEDLGNGQQSLFKLYDFSIIPIEFISNVYESFIGKKGQEDESAYYTPLFLVDYILNETVEKYLENNPTEYNCKVLDPACGSGIFLVETLRRIIERYIFLHPNVKKDSDEFKETLKSLAKNNIFGIDKNLAAIQVAIFSIQLTLSDYQEPSSIETFRFPTLLHTNFFNADFFNTEHEYNRILNDNKPDFILGNPPWKGSGIDAVGKKYLKTRKAKEKGKNFSIAVNNGEIAEGFVLRVSDFTNQNTLIALIVRSSILYNLGYKTNRSAFRDYWTEEFFIDKVFELAPVRHEVFDKSNDPAIAPAAILFYKYANGQNTNNNIIEHVCLKPSRFFSLFKIFSINRNDIKKIEQKKIKENDWLWKVLVYGSYLDFNFIQELHNKYKKVSKIIDNKNKFIVSTGLHCRKKDVNPPKDTEAIRYIDSIDVKAIDLMFIDHTKKKEIDFAKIDIVKDDRIYKAPMLLIKKGIDIKTLNTKSAISNKDLLFKDGITSIKPLTNEIEILSKISALLFSNLYSYFAINTFASIGIEREQAQNYNKFSIPYIDCNIASYVSNIENLKEQIHNEKQKYPKDENIINSLSRNVDYNLQKIDKEIFKTLALNDVERSLIDYALKINRPIITRKKNTLPTKIFQPYSFKDNELNNYANLFINRFSHLLSTEEQTFVTEVWHSKQIIGMFFKVVPKSNNQESITWIDKSEDELLSTAIKLSSQKITDKLFVQKDLRGFEKDYFYIFKPNEKRLWHKAIGYQDVEEFMDAMLKTGRRNCRE